MKTTVEKLVVTVTGASLSVNAWLIKDKVGDMGDTLKDISAKIGELSIEQAAVKTQVINNTNAIAWLQRKHNKEE